MPASVPANISLPTITDDTTAGRLRAELVRGDLAWVPFDPSQYTAGNTGSTVSFNQGGFPDNPDGSNTLLYISVPTGLNGARISIPFYGSVFGVRWRLNTTGFQIGSVTVDGETVAMQTEQPTVAAWGIGGLLTQAMQVTHPLLPERWHVGHIDIPAIPGSTNAIYLYGMLLEKRVGYERPPLRVGLMTQSTVTTAGITLGYSGSYAAGWFRKILFYNIDSSAHAVTIKYGSNIIAAMPLTAAGTAGAYWEWDQGMPANVAGLNAITFSADANSVINYTIMGGGGYV